MDMLALGAVGVVAALFAVMVRQRPRRWPWCWPWRACVLCLLWNTLPLLESIRDVMEELASLTEISPALLWAHAPDGGAGPGDQAGRRPLPGRRGGSLAAFVEVAGAAAAVLVALPLLKMVLQLVMGLL